MNTTRSADGTAIAYDVQGTGPALIYVTGATCFRSFLPIRKDVNAFAKEFTVYNYDRRGRGDSGDTAPWSIEREVEDIESLINAAGGSAFVYGHSSGAVLGLEAALQLGDKVKRLVMYDASYVHDIAEQAAYQVLEQAVTAHLDRRESAAALRTFLTGIGMPKAMVALLPLFPGWRSMKALAPTLRYDIALTETLPPIERAATLATPVHILVGEKSPGELHAVAEQLAAAIPGASHEALPGQNHLASAKALLPKLVEFLKQQEIHPAR